MMPTCPLSELTLLKHPDRMLRIVAGDENHCAPSSLSLAAQYSQPPEVDPGTPEIKRNNKNHSMNLKKLGTVRERPCSCEKKVPLSGVTYSPSSCKVVSFYKKLEKSSYTIEPKA